MRMPRLKFLVACSLATLGCDPVFSVGGIVVEKGSGSGIEGAEIRVTCGTLAAIEGKSDPSGEFWLQGSTGIIPKDPCDMVIDKAGYEAGRPTITACTSKWSSCKRKLGPIELIRK